MTMHIDPARVRRMAADYEDATASYAGFEFPAAGVSGSSFGDVDLAVWFTAITEQLGAAGTSLHGKAGSIGQGLLATADAAEQADADATERSIVPRTDLENLMLGPLDGIGLPNDPGPYGGM